MEKKQPLKDEYLNLNFFKNIWYSITKFEKYPEMAASGVKKAIIYFTKLMLIYSLVVVISVLTYTTYVRTENEETDNKLLDYITEQIDREIYTEEQINQILEELNNNSSTISIVFAMCIGIFITLFIVTFLDVIMLSIVGIFIEWVAKIKINYKALFNMSIYALTLSILCRMIYTIITIFTSFEIQHFSILYTSISYITLAAAIFMIKSDVMKQHIELMKIIEEGREKIEKTIVIPRNKKEDEDEETDEEKKEEQNDTKGQGSNA